MGKTVRKTKKENRPKSSKKIKPLKKTDPAENEHLSHLDRMLIAELGARGKGRLLEVAQLIEQGAHINCKDYRGYTPVYFECTKSLIAAGAKLNFEYGTGL